MYAEPLVTRLHRTGDPLYMLAADALAQSQIQVQRLRERVEQLEAIARLNAETIRCMQQAALEAASVLYRSSTTSSRSSDP